MKNKTKIVGFRITKIFQILKLFAKGKKYAFKKCDHFSSNTSYFWDISQILLGHFIKHKPLISEE